MTTDLSIVRLHTTDPYALDPTDRMDPVVIRACVECGAEFVPTVGATDWHLCAACATEEDVREYARTCAHLGGWADDQADPEWTIVDYLASMEA
jgi:hypothetical protein